MKNPPRFRARPTSIRIASYSDLIKHPHSVVQTADAVAYKLESDAEFVAWVLEWLSDSKSITSSDHHAQVVAGDVEAKTEKAVLVATRGGEAWLPKSQIRIFERVDGAALTTAGVHDETAESNSYVGYGSLPYGY